MSTLPIPLRPVQTRAEDRLDKYTRHLAALLQRGTVQQAETWQRVRAIGLSLGLTVEESEQYADRWMLDGPVF